MKGKIISRNIKFLGRLDSIWNGGDKKYGEVQL